MIRSPNIFETFVTVENELPKSGSGISNDTLPRSKSGVSSVVVDIGCLVVGGGGGLLPCNFEEIHQLLLLFRHIFRYRKYLNL